MKIARLPDGQMMEFPPDLPDDEMDRLVRQKMGVPDPVEPEEAMMELVAQIMQSQQQISAAIEQQSQMIVQALQQVAQTQALLAQKADEAIMTLGAPKTIVKDSTGKPIGVRVG